MTSISLDQANQIIDAALARSREAGYKPMAIAVLDDAGHLKAFQREDGASMFRFDIARVKAWGAVGMGGFQPDVGRTREGQSELLRVAGGHGRRKVSRAARRRAHPGRVGPRHRRRRGKRRQRR